MKVIEYPFTIDLQGKDGETINIDVRYITDIDYTVLSRRSIISFDIETSHDENNTRSWMYIFQVCIDGVVYIGRQWQEFINFIMKLPKYTRIYVHNFSYEWAFIKDFFKWSNILARSERKIVAARTDTGIEFRCTYLLTGKSLDKMAQDSPEVTVCKQVGKLNYDKYRTPKTDLTFDEYRYIVADVYIIWEYLKSKTNLPYTKTGYVRRAVRRQCRNDTEYIDYAKKSLLPYSVFEQYKKAYFGGDVHASEKYARQLLHTYNYDISSSYPYRMIKDDFPASPAIVSAHPANDIHKIKDSKLYIATFIIKGIHLKSWDDYPTISISKCTRYRTLSESNGRVIKADYLELTITSIDFEILNRNYYYDDIICTYLIYHDKSELLPLSFRKTVLDFYIKKTELKGVHGEEENYMLNKANVNSVYGMTVTFPIMHDMLYNNGKWEYDGLSDVECYEKHVFKSPYALPLPYSIGIWVTAYARNDLDKMRHKCRAVYWDTDSIKSLDNISDIITDENIRRESELSKLYTIDEYAPKDIRGNRHCIGIWDSEGETDLIAWGSKKYGYYTADGEPHITVAGCSKNGAVKWLKDTCHKLTDINDGTIIPAEYSGRMSALYIDNLEPLHHADGSITIDKSCVVLRPVEYSFDSTVNFINAVRMAQNNEFIGGKYYD